MTNISKIISAITVVIMFFSLPALSKYSRGKKYRYGQNRKLQSDLKIITSHPKYLSKKSGNRHIFNSPVNKRNRSFNKKSITLNKIKRLTIVIKNIHGGKDFFIYIPDSSKIRKRRGFIRYSFNSENFKRKMRGIKKYAVVSIRLIKLEYSNRSPKNKIVSKPRGGFKTYTYHAKIIRVISKR